MILAELAARIGANGLQPDQRLHIELAAEPRFVQHRRPHRDESRVAAAGDEVLREQQRGFTQSGITAVSS